MEQWWKLEQNWSKKTVITENSYDLGFLEILRERSWMCKISESFDWMNESKNYLQLIWNIYTSRWCNKTITNMLTNLFLPIQVT